MGEKTYVYIVELGISWEGTEIESVHSNPIRAIKHAQALAKRWRRVHRDYMVVRKFQVNHVVEEENDDVIFFYPAKMRKDYLP